MGPRAGQKLFTLQTVPARPEEDLQGDHRGAANAGGFSLHAGLDLGPQQRAKLERLCRYVSRPPIAEERLALTSSGQVRYQLKTRYRDGTTHIVMEPLDPIARLAAPEARLWRCARCGGKRMIIASIEDPAVIAKILAHLEKTAPDHDQAELPLGARAPPTQARPSRPQPANGGSRPLRRGMRIRGEDRGQGTRRHRGSSRRPGGRILR